VCEFFATHKLRTGITCKGNANTDRKSGKWQEANIEKYKEGKKAANESLRQEVQDYFEAVARLWEEEATEHNK
jgi:hypothetical protein